MHQICDILLFETGSLNIDGRGIRGSKSESYAPSKKCNPSSGVSDTETSLEKIPFEGASK